MTAQPPIIWPPSADALGDSARCPSCFTALASSVCAACGLDLRGEDARHLSAIAREMMAADGRRVGQISAMRRAQGLDAPPAPAAAPRPAQPSTEAHTLVDRFITGVPVPPASPPAPEIPAPEHAVPVGIVRPPFPGRPEGAAPAPLPAPAPYLAPAPAHPAPAVPAAPGRSGVQVLLLTLGVVLVSVAAIFFATLAYLVTSPPLRAVILLVVAIAIAAVAARLQRRLPGTAQFLAILSVLIALIDGAMVRSLGLWGTAPLDPLLFAGLLALLLAAACLGAARLTRVPAFYFQALVLVPVAGFGILGGLGTTAELTFWLGGLGGAIAVLAWGAARRRTGSAPGAIEETLQRSLEIGLAAIATLALPALAPAAIAGSDPLPTGLCVLVTAALWFQIMAVQERHSLVLTAAIPGGILATLAPLAWAVRENTTSWYLTALLLSSALIAAALAAVAARSRRNTLGATAAARAALITATAVSALSAFPLLLEALGTILIASAEPVLWGHSGYRFYPEEGIALRPEMLLAVLGTLALIGAGITALGRLRRYRTALATGLAGVIILIAILLPGIWVAATVLTVLAAAGILALPRAPRPVPRGIAVGLILVALGSAAMLSHAQWTLWACIAAAHILLLLFWRARSPEAWLRTALSALAFIILLRAGAEVTGVLRLETDVVLTPALSVAFLALLLCALLGLAGRRAQARPAAGLEPRVLSGLALLTVAVSGTLALVPYATPALRPWQCALLLAAAAVGLIRVALPHPYLAISRVIFAVLTPAALLGAVALIGLPSAWLWPVQAGLILALALIARPLLPLGSPRWLLPAWYLAPAAYGLVLGGIAGWWNRPHGWIELLLLAAAALVAGGTRGNPLRSDSGPWRYASWPALPAVVSAWWMIMDNLRVTLLEARTVPVALLLLALAAGLALADRGAAAGPARAGRSILATLGLLLLLLPSTWPGDPGRLLLICALALILCGLALFLAPARWRGILVRIPALLIGVFLVLGTALLRGLLDGITFEFPAPVDGWAMVLILLTALLTAASVRGIPARGPEVRLIPVLAALSLAAAGVLLLAATIFAAGDPVRPLIGLVLLGAIAVAALLGPDRTRILLWVALTVQPLLALIAAAEHPRIAPEAFSLPVALTALALGVLHVARTPGARTMPWIGPGLAILLLPSLLLSWIEPEMWRLVGLGVVSLAVLLLGVFRGWQAPVVLGGGVLLIHALVQLFPAIRVLYESVPWGIWAALGGALLIVVGATYESRVRQARIIGRRISALR
ncbi:SCO7613 C-terminal domain-containing membrane protein [Mycetocola spongiae]|uniref:SCO7613 C-terminal domain-containing membrane protein n=1 Tax=Mycetocola spongiae TaxID=2859226 RepID=UPI001CF5C8D2|nr:hypothetical protein [Mycetocola spongiae]UCR89316.1 hypothetical protein KXZ72_00985 [Mycetocola spongiae]